MKKFPDKSDGLESWIPRLLASARGGGNRLNLHAGKARLSEQEEHVLARSIRELSRGFTRERGLAGAGYMGDENLLAAYLMYYWPVSYMQARLAFTRLLPPELVEGASVLELGSGPAAGLFALLDMGAGSGIAADSSRAATSLAGRLAKAAGKNMRAAFWDGVKGTQLPAGNFGIILMSHVLNEMWPGKPDRIGLRLDRITSIMESLSEKGVLVIIEPALLSVTRDLLMIQEGMVERGWRIMSPCTAQIPCPCLREEAATCHANFSWNPPAAVIRLAHKARLGKESLKFAFLAVGKSGSAGAEGASLYRVVSEPMLSKSGRRRILVCGHDGRFSVSAPAADKKWNDAICRCRRYDLVTIDGAQKREHGVGLVAKSRFVRVSGESPGRAGK